MNVISAAAMVTVACSLSGCASLGVYDWMGKHYDRIVWSGRDKPLETATQPDPARKTPTPAAFLEWLRQNETYIITQLCTTPVGEAHALAWDQWHFAVSIDTDRVQQAPAKKYRVVVCPADGDSLVEANRFEPPATVVHTVEPRPTDPTERQDERTERIERRIDRALNIVLDVFGILFLRCAFSEQC